MTFLRIAICSKLCLEHDLFRKPVPTFRDHALTCAVERKRAALAARAPAAADVMLETGRGVVLVGRGFHEFGGEQTKLFRQNGIMADARHMQTGLGLLPVIVGRRHATPWELERPPVGKPGSRAVGSRRLAGRSTRPKSKGRPTGGPVSWLGAQVSYARTRPAE